VWFYVPALLTGALPGSVIFALAVTDWVWRGKKKSWQSSPGLLPALWFLLLFVFLSLALGKREVYLLPLYPALGLVVGLFLDRALAQGRRVVLAISAGWLALFALLIAAVGIMLWQLLETRWGLALAGFGVTAGVVIGVCAFRQSWAWAAAASVVLLGLALTTAALALTPLAAYRPSPQFAELIRQQARPGDRVATYLTALPSLIFYTRGPVEACQTREEFAAQLTNASRVFAVMHEADYEAMAREFPNHSWQVLLKRPYLQLTGAQLKRLRAGQIGLPLVLARIEPATPAPSAATRPSSHPNPSR